MISISFLSFPQDAERACYESVVNNIRGSDYAMIHYDDSCGQRLRLNSKEEFAAKGSFRYDLVCRERIVPFDSVPECTHCRVKGHIKHFCFNWQMMNCSALVEDDTLPTDDDSSQDTDLRFEGNEANLPLDSASREEIYCPFDASDDRGRSEVREVTAGRGRSVDRRSMDRYSTDRRSTDRHSMDRRSTDRRSADRHSMDRRSADSPSADRLSADRRSGDRRSMDGRTEHSYEEETRSVNIEKKQTDKRDVEEEKKEAEKREADKREAEKREAEKKKTPEKIKKYIPIEAPLCDTDSPKMVGVREIRHRDLKRATSQEKKIAETMLTVRLRMNRFANTGFPYGTFGTAEALLQDATKKHEGKYDFENSCLQGQRRMYFAIEGFMITQMTFDQGLMHMTEEQKMNRFFNKVMRLLTQSDYLVCVSKEIKDIEGMFGFCCFCSNAANRKNDGRKYFRYDVLCKQRYNIEYVDPPEPEKEPSKPEEEPLPPGSETSAANESASVEDAREGRSIDQNKIAQQPAISKFKSTTTNNPPPPGVTDYVDLAKSLCGLTPESTPDIPLPLSAPSVLPKAHSSAKPAIPKATALAPHKSKSSKSVQEPAFKMPSTQSEIPKSVSAPNIPLLPTPSPPPASTQSTTPPPAAIVGKPKLIYAESMPLQIVNQNGPAIAGGDGSDVSEASDVEISFADLMLVIKREFWDVLSESNPGNARQVLEQRFSQYSLVRRFEDILNRLEMKFVPNNEGKYCSFSMLNVAIKVVIVNVGNTPMSYEKAKFEFILDTIISMFMSDYLLVAEENGGKKLKLFLSFTHPVSKGAYRYDQLCLWAAAHIAAANEKIKLARELEEKKKVEEEEKKRLKVEEKKRAKEEEKRAKEEEKRKKNEMKKMEDELKRRTEEIKRKEKEIEDIKKKELEEKKKMEEAIRKKEIEEERRRRRAKEEEEKIKRKEELVRKKEEIEVKKRDMEEKQKRWVHEKIIEEEKRKEEDRRLEEERRRLEEEKIRKEEQKKEGEKRKESVRKREEVMRKEEDKKREEERKKREEERRVEEKRVEEEKRLEEVKRLEEIKLRDEERSRSKERLEEKRSTNKGDRESSKEKSSEKEDKVIN